MPVQTIALWACCNLAEELTASSSTKSPGGHSLFRAHRHQPFRHRMASSQHLLAHRPKPARAPNAVKGRDPGRRGTANGPWPTAVSRRSQPATPRPNRADVHPPRRTTSHPTEGPPPKKAARHSKCRASHPSTEADSRIRSTTVTAWALRHYADPKAAHHQRDQTPNFTRKSGVWAQTAGCSATPPVRFGTFRRGQRGDRHVGLPHRRHPLPGFLTLSAA
jgi:hypothetical protein